MILFRRLPRNASTSIESVSHQFGAFGILKSRVPLSEYRHLEDWRKIFAVIRNPYDRVVSMYHWFESWSLSFDGFVESLVERKGFNDEQLWHTEPQYPYVTVDGKVAVTLLRFDNLKEEFEKFCETLGMSIELPHLNKSEDKCYYKGYYNTRTLNLVKEIYEDDFRLLKF